MTPVNTAPVVELVEIASVVIADRSRDVDDAWVNVLAAMIREEGMMNPITLWRGPEGPQLVAGLHRIGAYELNGETHIPATWSSATSFEQAKVQEIIENIGRRELNALDRAQHLNDLKEAYEALHPEAKKGGDRKSKEARENQSEIISFSSEAAETAGLSPRAIQMAVALWKNLSPASKSVIKGTWLADHQAGLMALSKQSPKVQAKVLGMIFPPRNKPAQATNVADALYIIENGRLLSSTEKRFAGINNTIQTLAVEELDAVLTANEERIMAWVERRIGGSKKGGAV